MTVPVKTHLIKIGNSQGIRIPKLLLEQAALDGEVELLVQQDQLVIRAARRPRHDWGEQFKAMAERGDDRLLHEEALTLTQWDAEEWAWT